MSGQQIAGSVALVTGANRGIGRAITEALLENGAAKVYAAARRTSELDALAQRHGARLVVLALDVTDPAQVAAVAAATSDVNILVNNAGVASAPFGAAITDTAHFESARAEMEVNYFGSLRLLQAVAPTLAVNGGGSIVNISSVAGLTNFPAFASYSASKAAVRSLTQAARVQLAGQGTQVIGVYPGPVDTDMAADVPMEKVSPASVAAEILAAIEHGTLEVFPDPVARQFGEQFESSPSGLERHVAEMMSRAA